MLPPDFGSQCVGERIVSVGGCRWIDDVVDDLIAIQEKSAAPNRDKDSDGSIAAYDKSEAGIVKLVPPDASVARRGALPCLERPRGGAVTPRYAPAAACMRQRRRIPAGATRGSPFMDQYWNSP